MKKAIRILVMSLMAILMAGMVSALTCVIRAPVNGAIISGATVVWNVSSSSADNFTLSNCTISGTSALDTLSVVLKNYSLAGGLITWANATASTMAEVDGSDWAISATCRNASNDVFTCTGTGTITIDNTVPVLTLSTPTDLSIDTDGVVTFNYACVNTSSATLMLENKPYTMTESSDVCTYTNPTTSKLTNGFQSWYITASDGYSTTTSSTTKVEIRKPGGPILDEAGNEVGTATTTTTEPTDTSKFGGTFGLIVFGAIIWYFIGKGKKKK